MGAQFIREVEPGEIVAIDDDGLHSHRPAVGAGQERLCVFEFIYLARPDSVIGGRCCTRRGWPWGGSWRGSSRRTPTW